MKLRYVLVILLLFGISQPCFAQKKRNHKAARTESSTSVQPTWESINQRGYPQWFSDAKLGIFIHWGLYSVPSLASSEGYGEWFYRGLMTNQKERTEVMKFYTDTTQPAFSQYADLRNLWHAEMWNPDEWADLFKRAGAQYILLVTKHHDGYCLWDNQSTYDSRKEWNSVLSGPRRDICEELSVAVRKKGIRFGAYYSLTEWTNPRHIWMQHPDDSISDYVENYMIPQFKDMVTRYRPDVLFTDGEWNNSAAQFHAPELISWYYNTIGPDAICNNRWGSGEQHGFRTPEYSSGITMTDRPWAECRGLGRSFGWNRREPIENFLTSEELIQHFCKLVSAGGGMTLNVGPMADGKIPLIQQERLLDLGKWLEANGEAIYATRPWERFNDNRTESISRKDSVINFDWVRNSPDKAITYDNFNVIWNGTIIPTSTDFYTFTLSADDSATMFISDIDDPQQNHHQLIATKDTQETTVHLQAGHRYLIFVNYEERDLESRCSLYWHSRHMKEQLVRPINGFEGTYSCQKPYVCYTRKDNNLYAIALGWQNKLVIPYSTSPSEDMKITFLGSNQEDIPWHYDAKSEQIVIKADVVKIEDIIKQQGTYAFKIEGLIN